MVDDIGGARVVTPTPGLVGVRPSRWAYAAAAGSRLLVHFYAEPVSAVDRVEVGEAPDRVTVTLYVGVRPGRGRVVALQLAEHRAVEVDLQAPLGDRRVVDGAPDATDPP